MSPKLAAEIGAGLLKGSGGVIGGLSGSLKEKIIPQGHLDGSEVHLGQSLF